MENSTNISANVTTNYNYYGLNYNHYVLNYNYNGALNNLLLSSAQNGDIDLIKKSIKAGADVNAINNDGIFPLLIAAQNGHVHIVEILIKAGADVNAMTNNDGISPLYIAAQSGHIEVVNLLIINGANVNTINKDDSSPLLIAAMQGHVDVVETLINNGGTANDQKMYLQLLIAASEGNVDSIKGLIKAGANVNNRADDVIFTPLLLAVYGGFIDATEMLIKAGADVDVQDTKDGISALYLAAEKGLYDVTKSLIKAGANVNTENYDGGTALGVACYYGNTEIINSLLAIGSSSKHMYLCEDSELENIRQIAESYNQDQIRYILKSHQEAEPALTAINELIKIQETTLKNAVQKCKQSEDVVCVVDKNIMIQLIKLEETKACLESQPEVDLDIVKTCGHHHDEL